MHVDAIRKVLYIEDNQVNALLIEQWFLSIGAIELKVVETGTAGLASARLSAPDLVLLDMNLPDLLGIDVLRELKGAEATASIPVVVLSAVALAEGKAEAVEAGAAAYWTKPVDFALMRSELASLLQLP